MTPTPNKRTKVITMSENIITTFIVAGVVISQDGKYLLVQEMKPSVRGQWNWPAGKVETGDTIERTAIKEAKEETGFDVELVRKIDIYQHDTTRPVQHVFEAKIVGGAINFPKDEIMDVRWFTRAELETMKDNLRGEWILDAIQQLESN